MSITRWGPLLLLLAGGGILGLEQDRSSTWLSRHDAVAHAIALGLLAWALRRALPGWSLLRIATVCVLAAVGAEALQAFVPGRTASWRDVAAGLLGLAAALVALSPGAIRMRREELDEE